MNSTLSQQTIDDALADDPQAAKSEYLGEFRDDVVAFLPRDILERLVVPGRAELMPRQNVKYAAFVDMSGGRADSATLAVAHQHERKVIVDSLKEWRPPFNPTEVITDMCRELRRFNLRHVTGDNYAGEYTASGFQNNGIRYSKSAKNKNELYLEAIGRFCSGEVELLDNGRLVDQLAGLERRTRSGGRDIVDHPAGGHDDLANAVAGVADITAQKRIRIGTF